MAQCVKDLALPLLWHWFHPWPGTFQMPQTWPKDKKAIISCLVSWFPTSGLPSSPPVSQ